MIGFAHFGERVSQIPDGTATAVAKSMAAPVSQKMLQSEAIAISEAILGQELLAHERLIFARRHSLRFPARRDETREYMRRFPDVKS